MLSRGRDGLTIICRILREEQERPKILVPAFICNVVPETIVANGVEVGFYDVDHNLIPIISSIDKKINENAKTLLFVNYFGFKQPVSIINLFHERGLTLIEDNTQAFLTPGSYPASKAIRWEIESYRKLLPLPDGATLRMHEAVPTPIALGVSMQQYKHILWRTLGIMVRGFIDKMPQHHLEEMERDMFTFAERSIKYTGPAAMSGLSKTLLPWLDISKIIYKRRKNYAHLLDAFKDEKHIKPIFKELFDKVCPFGFPIVVKQRERLRHMLNESKITAAVLWDKPKMLNEGNIFAAQQLWDNILVLPVGPSYNEFDMQRMCCIVKDHQA